MWCTYNVRYSRSHRGTSDLWLMEVIPGVSRGPCFHSSWDGFAAPPRPPCLLWLTRCISDRGKNIHPLPLTAFLIESTGIVTPDTGVWNFWISDFYSNISSGFGRGGWRRLYPYWAMPSLKKWNRKEKGGRAPLAVSSINIHFDLSVL